MDARLSAVSAEYRKEARNAVLFIVLFFIIYLVLILISLALIAILVYFAVQLLAYKTTFWSALLSAGLVGMGVLIIIFLFKFMFSSNKADSSDLVEIKRNEEPELFRMIDEVVQKVQTQQPKKVFLTYEVNAFVNYNSTFWSMFFPVRKNLTIGMGLINTCTVSELKGILAHEFGHFSQRSMKVGSFVYQANKIIYDMLYNNDGFEKISNYFASIHGILHFFSQLAMLYVSGIKWVLIKFYDLLYLRHMSLSRQMEFNADAIATNIVGSEVNKTALLRIDLSETAFSSSVNFFSENTEFSTKDIYKDQATLLKFYAEENRHEIENGLPTVNEFELERYNKSKLKIEDQWSSHPSISQRIAAVKKLDIPNQSPDNRLAHSIFRHFDRYAKLFTEKVFTLYQIEDSHNDLSASEFLEKFKMKREETDFSKKFNSYYDLKNPVVAAFKSLERHDPQNAQAEDFYTDEVVALVYEKHSLTNDSSLMQQIAEGNTEIRTFDYDGRKYSKKQAAQVKTIMDQRLEEVDAEIVKNDEKIYRFTYSRATPEEKIQLSEMQQKFNDADLEFDEFANDFQNFIPFVDFMSQTLQFDEIVKHRSKLLTAEKDFKTRIGKLLTDSSLSKNIPEIDRTVLEQYRDADLLYFNKDHYIGSDVEQLNSALGAYQNSLSKSYFKQKKQFLDFMAEIQFRNS